MTLHLLPYHEDLLERAAQVILRQARDSLPDLSGYIALLPDVLTAPLLRARLAAQAQTLGHRALLGLRVTTLRTWIEAGGADPAETRTPLSEPARRLLLVEALRQHRSLFGDDDPWRVADSLLQLFDELSRCHTALPATAADLAVHLAAGYDIHGEPPAALTREAEIVHRLWQAWREQTEALGRPDPWVHYLDALRARHGIVPTEPYYFILGHQALIPAEQAWVDARLAAGRAMLLLHGNPPVRRTRADATLSAWRAWRDAGPDDGPDHGQAAPAAPGARCLDAVYPQTDSDLRQRAAQLHAAFTESPVAARLAMLAADSAEHEARAVDVQVRRWLLEGRTRIGIVTEDRRLARRVRALLERAGVPLADSGGWALSTTSAAACVERWLQCCEEDFAQQPLLDVLKSPFLYTATERTEHLACVYRLEHDIIQHENIARGLERYRRHIEYRRQRLHAWLPGSVAALHALLDRIGTAARPLLDARVGTHPAGHYLAALRDSLQRLGAWALLEEDAAGQRLLALWEELNAAARHTPLQLDWAEFRIWLGRALEENTFRPGLAEGPVQLFDLDQALLPSFDAVVLCACDRAHLPGSDRATPFFNAGVRRELGLPTWEERLDRRLYQFRRLLEAAPRVLLTWHREDQGEPLLPAPWIEILERLHTLAFGHSLQDRELKALLDADVRISPPQPAPLPVRPVQPRPSLPRALLPETVSASSHQHLIDCPYLYFAADGLRLAPAETVRELLQKSDYGERVHRCLQAFHGSVKGLPEPFTRPLDTTTRSAAIAHLQTITAQVFARDLEDNFQHRGWLKLWWRLIPDYIDWQIERATHWQVHEVEARRERPCAGVGTLRGRLDRIDRATDGAADGQLAIVDYKTGRQLPSQRDIDSGEAVQLPFYALLTEGAVARVEYLRLDEAPVRTAGALEGDELEALRSAVATRLQQTQTAIAAGQPLPAWGDPQTCRRCTMSGICRREAW
ncbi:MAG: PD-(D/E)XK nuclease family protein [Thiohalobacteraceae bacterium]